MSTERTRDTVMVDLARATQEKEAAVHRQAFGEAADSRGKELALQKELHALGGPPPGMYRVRIDRPDGSHQTVEGPHMTAMYELLGFVDYGRELNLVLEVAAIIALKMDKNAGIRIEMKKAENA